MSYLHLQRVLCDFDLMYMFQNQFKKFKFHVGTFSVHINQSMGSANKHLYLNGLALMTKIWPPKCLVSLFILYRNFCFSAIFFLYFCSDRIALSLIYSARITPQV